MPHQNKPETEDMELKKRKELSFSTNSTVLQDATSFFTGKLAEGKAQTSTDEVQGLVF